MPSPETSTAIQVAAKLSVSPTTPIPVAAVSIPAVRSPGTRRAVGEDAEQRLGDRGEERGGEDDPAGAGEVVATDRDERDESGDDAW